VTQPLTDLLAEAARADVRIVYNPCRNGLRWERPRGGEPLREGLIDELREHRDAILQRVRDGSLWSRAASAVLAGIEDAGERADLREAFEERAAIAEFDGRLSRLEAERSAFREIARACERWRV